MVEKGKSSLRYPKMRLAVVCAYRVCLPLFFPPITFIMLNKMLFFVFPLCFCNSRAFFAGKLG